MYVLGNAGGAWEDFPEGSLLVTRTHMPRLIEKWRPLTFH